MTSYRDELDWAYHGEVYGEAMFAAMADVTEDPTRAAELSVLALVERQTKEQLAPLCDREGIERDDATHEARGRKLADRAARPGWDWERFLHSFQPLTDQALLRYRSMRDVLAPKDDAPTMRSLVVHEEVLQRYAERALAGEEAPTAPMVDALEGEHRRAAEQLLRDAAATADAIDGTDEATTDARVSTETAAREALLATAVGLGTSLEAAATLAAHLRVVGEGLAVQPETERLLAAVAAELLGADPAVAGAGSLPAQAVVGMVRAWLHQATELVEDPGRSGTWDRVDPALLQGLGRLSMAVADAVRVAGAHLEGLTAALASAGASILDVGTGTGWLAIALARANPTATVVGIDVFEPALALARANLAQSGLGERVELRHQDVTDLADSARYDAVWLPLPFLPPAVVPTALARCLEAVRPGGWVLPGAFAGPPDRLSQLLVDLRTVRCGGRTWPAHELRVLMVDCGYVDAGEVPRTWAAPVRLFAARRP